MPLRIFRRGGLLSRSDVRRAGLSGALIAALGVTCICLALINGSARADNAADTALVVAVDVSQSVNEQSYRLQIEGIALALEDASVINAILSGAHGSILFALVTWADTAQIALPWRRIASVDDARETAALIRALPKRGGEFTCLARALRIINELVLPPIPLPATRAVVDISGDGIDNCAEREVSESERDALISSGVTINGLPIMIPGENDVVGSGAYRAPGYGLKELPRGPDTDTTTLDVWYRDHVIGGRGAFLLPAMGYEDFGRAFREKFVTEISGGSTRKRDADLITNAISDNRGVF